MVGVGPDGERWHRLCQRLDLTHAVDWHGWMEQAKLGAIYAKHHAFLFPSLHDSSGNVVLEAMSHGLPVVCFDLGGPGVLVTDRIWHRHSDQWARSRAAGGRLDRGDEIPRR